MILCGPIRRHGDGLDALSVQPANGFLSANPECSLIVLHHSAERNRPQSARRRENFESAVRVPRQPAPRAQPERALPILIERKNVVRIEFSCVRRIGDREPHAVEARHAVGRTQPEIAIPRFDDRADSVVRDAVSRAPVPDDIFGRRVVRGEWAGGRERKNGQSETQPQEVVVRALSPLLK